MSVLDTPLRQVAKTVINRFGMAVTVQTMARSTYNVTTGQSTLITTATSLKGLLSEYHTREIGDAIKAGDRKLEIAAALLSTAPDTEDRVVIGSAVYRIVRVITHWAGGEAALYECQLRGNA